MVSLWYLYGIYIGGRTEELRFIIGLRINAYSCHIWKEKSVQQHLLNGLFFL